MRWLFRVLVLEVEAVLEVFCPELHLYLEARTPLRSGGVELADCHPVPVLQTAAIAHSLALQPLEAEGAATIRAQ